MRVARLVALCVVASLIIVTLMIFGLSEIGVVKAGELGETLEIAVPMAAAVPLLISFPVIWKILSMADELAEAKAELQRLSETDHLTGLLNRRGFDLAAQRLIERAKSDRVPVAMIACDIDHFKAINDTYGHAAGDVVISRVAHLIRDEIENCPMLDYCAGRMGGEEYAVLLSGVPIRPLAAYAERIRRRCGAEPVRAESAFIAVTVSIGIGVASHRDASLTDLMEIADRGLYRAKSDGRNRVGHEAGMAGRAAVA